LKQVLVTGVGDLLSFPKGFIVNFVLRHVRKQVPHWKMPGSMSFKSALGTGLGLKLQPVDLAGEDVACLQYTGGTTGVAKAAILTHRNIVANLLQSMAWIKPALQVGGQLITIIALPMYHIFGLTNCLSSMPLGSTIS
jgi:long-chain acyl-CoA synthetase